MAKKRKSRRKKTSKSPKQRKKKKEKGVVIKSIFAVLVIIVLALIITKSSEIFPGKTGIVAEVNGQKITPDELDNEYERMVSVEYRDVVTKDIFLNQSMIPEVLLLQEAKKQNIKVSRSETEQFISDFLAQSDMTKEEFEEQIKAQGMDYDGFVDFYSERLTVVKLLNRTVGVPEVTDEELRQFYDDNMASFSAGNQTFDYEDIKDQIKTLLVNQKQQEEIANYMAELRDKADIKINWQNIQGTTGRVDTFQDTGDEICYENGKPVIRLFSTTTCPHCKWIKKTFDSIANEYIEKGLITAYHWEIDEKDNTLTDDVEGALPDKEVVVLQRYSNGGVPLFVFGCKYVRVGNVYESQDDLAAEEAELRYVIESLLIV